MSLRKLILALTLCGGVGFAIDAPQTQPIGPFGGLNTNISQEAIDSSQSPDLLNVDISQGGKSVKKRQGYGLDATLAVSSDAVHNIYKFFDSSGNEVRLAFNDNRVSSSVGGAAWSVILTTGTVGATWDCTDYLGFAYCVSSSFDNPIKTNGTTAGTTGAGGTNAVPAGSLISNTGDRLLVGATAANPSRLYYSASAVFSDFSAGIQPSSSLYEDIVAPGSKLTHLAHHYGRWLWWKDQSFGFIVGTSQFDLQIITVSNTVGTLDNTDVFEGGITYFRGSDSQIYTYNGSTLSRAISADIAPTLRTTNRRKANTWSQTSQTDFQAGSIVPTGQLSTTVSTGDVTSSTFTTTTNSSTTFNLGTFGNITETNLYGIANRALALSTNNSGTATNSGFESAFAGNWTDSHGLGTAWTQDNAAVEDCGTLSANTGSFYARRRNSGVAIDAAYNSAIASFSIWDASTNVGLSTKTITYTGDCTWRQLTHTDSTNVGRRVKFVFYSFSHQGGGAWLMSSDSYIWGGSSSFYYVFAPFNTYSADLSIDTVENGSSTVSSGWYLSKTYDTGLTSSTIQMQNDYTVSTSTPSFALQSSTSTLGVWSTITTSTGVNVSANRYVRFTSTISVASTENALTTISTVTLVAASSGTYYSAVNAAASLTSWNTIAINDTAGSSITYYTRASTGIFTVLSATPTWVAQTKNATVTASTGTYMQLRADFAVVYATSPPTLNDFTFNWYEGAASDKMYAQYFNNGLWFSVSLGSAATTNNRIFRYDLLSNLWTLYDVPANGFLIYNNGLYFGDPTAGKIYQFGNSVTSDNGSSINAYWKSKPFFGDSPFTDKDLRLASWYVAKASGTVLTMTYTLNESTAVTKTLNLYDANRNVIQNNWNFPLGSLATNFNVQFGDTSTNPAWEVFGGEIIFVPRPWKVYP